MISVTKVFVPSNPAIGASGAIDGGRKTIAAQRIRSVVIGSLATATVAALPAPRCSSCGWTGRVLYRRPNLAA